MKEVVSALNLIKKYILVVIEDHVLIILDWYARCLGRNCPLILYKRHAFTVKLPNPESVDTDRV